MLNIDGSVRRSAKIVRGVGVLRDGNKKYEDGFSTNMGDFTKIKVEMGFIAFFLTHTHVFFLVSIWNRFIKKMIY